MLFDAHAHLNDDDLFPKAEALRGEYLENGVGYVVNAGYDIPSSQKGKMTRKEYQGSLCPLVNGNDCPI